MTPSNRLRIWETRNKLGEVLSETEPKERNLFHMSAGFRHQQTKLGKKNLLHGGLKIFKLFMRLSSSSRSEQERYEKERTNPKKKGEKGSHPRTIGERSD